MPAPPSIVSSPAPPLIVSLPAPALITLAPLSPVSVSLYAEPVMFSMELSVSLPAPPEAVPVVRFTVTAELAFS